MATNALISIDEIVTRFLFKYKKPMEDANIFIEHICNLVRDFRIYDSNQVVSVKISINSLGIIEMPDDMIGFNDLCYAEYGEWVSFTERDRIVNTTTTTGGVEGHDSNFGEGVDIVHSEDVGYGAVGAINNYNYMIDWEARRIFCEGIISDTVLLRYVNSGIETSGITTVPEFITPMCDAYLLWKESYWVKGLERERQMREQDFVKAELRVRNFINSNSFQQWKDILLGITTQAPQR